MVNVEWSSLKTRKKHSGAFGDLPVSKKTAIRDEILGYIFNEKPEIYIKSGLNEEDDIWRYSTHFQEKLKKRLLLTENLWLPEKNYYVDGELFFQFFEYASVKEFTDFVLDGALFKNGDWLFQLSYLDVVERYCSFYPAAFYEELLNRYPDIAKVFLFTERANYIKSAPEKHSKGLNELVKFFAKNHSKLGFNNLYSAVKAFYKVFPKFFRGSNRHICWNELPIDFDFVEDWSLKEVSDIESLLFIQKNNKLKVFTLDISATYTFLENKILKIKVLDNFIKFCKIIFLTKPELSRSIPFIEVMKTELSVLKENTFQLAVLLKNEMDDETFYKYCNDLVIYFIYFVKSPLFKEASNSMDALIDAHNYLNAKQLNNEIKERIKDIPIIEDDSEDDCFKI